MEEVERRVRTGAGLCLSWIRVEGLVVCDFNLADAVTYALMYDLGEGCGCTVSSQSLFPSAAAEGLRREFVRQLRRLDTCKWWICEPPELWRGLEDEHRGGLLTVKFGKTSLCESEREFTFAPSRACVILLTSQRIDDEYISLCLEIFLATSSGGYIIRQTTAITDASVPVFMDNIRGLVRMTFAQRHLAPLLNRSTIDTRSHCVACDTPTTRANAAAHWFDRAEGRELFLCGSCRRDEALYCLAQARRLEYPDEELDPNVKAGRDAVRKRKTV